MKLFLGIILFFTFNCYSQTDSIKHNNHIDTTIYDLIAIEEPPRFPGGDGALDTFIRANLHYPELERKNEIQGNVFVSFVIDIDGSITNAKVYKGIPGGSGCNKEALRVVNLMPKWSPGKQDGKAVKVMFIFPIRFKLVSDSEVERNRLSIIYYNKGVENLKEGDYKKAIIDFDKSINTNPNNIDALYNKSLCLIALKENTKACETLQKIKKSGKPDADNLIKKYCSN